MSCLCCDVLNGSVGLFPLSVESAVAPAAAAAASMAPAAERTRARAS